MADRVVRVVAEHKEAHVALAGPASTVVPAAEAYIKVYDQAVMARAAQRGEMEIGRDSLRELWQQIRAGLAAVQYAMPAFDTSELTGSVDKPETLFSDGYKLIELVSKGGVTQGEAIVALLKAALEKAEPEWAKAQRARVALQTTQAVVRQHAVVLNRELVALRRVLGIVLGTSHLAYQTLRTSRVSNPDVIDEDDSVVSDTEDDTAAPGATNGATTNGKGHGAPFNLGALA